MANRRPLGVPLYRRRWFKVLAVLCAVLGCLVLAGYIAFPHIVDKLVRNQVEKLAEKLDRRISFDRFEIERLNRYHFHDLEISEDGDNQSEVFFAARRLTVTLDRAKFFTGRFVLRQIEIVDPVVYLRDYQDGESNYGSLLDQILEALGLVEPQPTPDTAEPPPTATEPEEPGVLDELLADGIPEVLIQNARVDLGSVDRERVPESIDNLAISVRPAGNGGFACDFAVSADIHGLPRLGMLRAPERVEVSGNVVPEDDVVEVLVGLGAPFELSDIPGFPEVMLRVDQIGFEYPYTFEVRQLEVLDRRTRSTVVEIPELTVSLREFTTNLPDLFISLVSAQGIRVYAEIDREGNTNIARLLSLEGPGPLAALIPNRTENDANPENAPPDGANGSAPSNDANEPEALSALEQEIARRRWWEVMPQTIELSDVQVEIVVHEDGQPIRTLDLAIPSVRGSQRLLNFQMDLATEMHLTERGVGGVGSIDLEGVYYWMTEHWDLALAFHDVSLGQFIDVMPFPNPLGILGGELDGTLRIAEARPEEDLGVEGDIQLTDFAVAAPAVHGEPLEDIDLHYDFVARYDTDRELVVRPGELKVGSAEASVELDVQHLYPLVALDYLLGFAEGQRSETYWEDRASLPPPWAEIRLAIDLPPQPIMAVFNAVPAVIRQPLEGTEMTGDVAWQLDARAIYERRDDGTLRVEIPTPQVANVDDEAVELVNLPPELDVRRLNESFAFTFVDGIGERRELAIGGDLNPRWVPLASGSHWMIQSILNTEDQRFFENRGFNWYQMRVVLARLLAEQELGRGASTISMQVVKNVFLSRERLVARKLVELFLTYWMDRLVLKKRILEIYLNVIEFGPGINGIAEAAEHYFGKLPRDLSLTEATFLVSIVPNPREGHIYYEMGEITDRWWNHMQRYLDRLLARHVITQEQYDEALRDRPHFYLREPGDPALRPPEPEVPFIPIFDDSIAPFD